MKIILIAGAILVPLLFPTASAISIELSQTCLAMHKANVTTDCPTYEDILALFPDTSNHRISGGFDYSEGIYQRQPTQFVNHYNFYAYQPDDVLWVDPPGDVRRKVPSITITSSDFEYKVPFQTITNGSIQVGQSRYVSSQCYSAIITAQNWIFLLGDTVNYMLKNCDPSQTNFDEIKIKKWETVNHDITTSAKYKLEQWQKQSIERCGQKVCKNEKTKFSPEGAG